MLSYTDLKLDTLSKESLGDLMRDSLTIFACKTQSLYELVDKKAITRDQALSRVGPQENELGLGIFNVILNKLNEDGLLSYENVEIIKNIIKTFELSRQHN